MNEQLFPSFKAFYGREPIAGKDYDPDGDMCQDDYEFLTGTGRYSDDVKPDVADTEPNLELSWRERFILHWWCRKHELKIGGLQLACNFSTREWYVLFYAAVFGYPMGMGMGSGDKPF
jgi:hypothetical protein